MADERIKLVLDTGPTAQAAAETTRAMQALENSVQSTADTYEVLDHGLTATDRHMEEMAREAVATGKAFGLLESGLTAQQRAAATATATTVAQTTALDALGIQLQKNVGLYQVVTSEMAAVGRAATTLRGTGGQAGMGILGASYAFQDFTSVLSGGGGFARALSSVQNNIPILVASLGVGAGLAGTVSIVSVGVGLLIDNWEKIQRLWGSGQTEEEAERMKKLAKATDDAREAAEKLSKAQPPWQQAAGKDVKRAVDAFGGPDVTKFLADAIVRARGDFGAANNANMARTLMANLMQGDRGAMEFMGELDLPGPIGQVLRGGRTPAEQQKFGADQAKQRRQEREAARRLKAQLDAERDRAEAQAQAEANRIRQQMEDEKARDEDKRIGDTQRLGRAMDRAFREQQADRRNANRAGPDELRHLPIIPENAGAAEIAAKTAETQQILNQSNAEMLKRLQAAANANAEARRMLRQLQAQTMSPLGP